MNRTAANNHENQSINELLNDERSSMVMLQKRTHLQLTKSLVRAAKRPAVPDNIQKGTGTIGNNNGKKRDYSIQRDLKLGTDRFQAAIFLHTIDTLLGMIQHHYGTVVKEKCKKMMEAKYENSTTGEGDANDIGEASLLLELMGASTATTNMAILHLQQLEHFLVQTHPHLSTIYRILACVLFGEVIDTLYGVVQKYNGGQRSSSSSSSSSSSHKTQSKLSREILTEFVGDILECGFRSDIDPKADIQKTLDAFEKKHGSNVPSDLQEWKRIVDLLHMRAKVETHSVHKLSQSDFLSQQLERFGLKPHTWFQGMAFMGGIRNILNTLCMLQWMGSIFGKHHQPGLPKLAPQQGFFGPRFLYEVKDIAEEAEIRKATGKNNKKNKGKGAGPPTPRVHRLGQADRIHSDMDDLLMTEILPELMAVCQGGVFSGYTFPLEDHMFPLLLILKRYVSDHSQPVPTTLMFAVHAMLVSIFELQDKGCLRFIATHAKVSNDSFDVGLEWKSTKQENDSDSIMWGGETIFFLT